MTDVIHLCACGQERVTSNKHDFAVCPHCDHPALHPPRSCEYCGRIKVTRTP